MMSYKNSIKTIVLLTAFAVISFQSSAQHTIILKSGEKMNGTVQSLSNGSITFLFKGNAMTFKVNEVSSIIFDGKAKAASANVTHDGSSRGEVSRRGGLGPRQADPGADQVRQLSRMGGSRHRGGDLLRHPIQPKAVCDGELPDRGGRFRLSLRDREDS